MTVPSPLAGRRAVVTGASSGIGAATARLLAARGARVALVARRRDRLDTLHDEITNEGGSSVPIACDLTDATAIEPAALSAVHALDGVDLLVNAAGILAPSFLADGPVDEWERQIKVNVTGLLRLSRALLPEMLKSASAGATTDLVNVSSVAASQPEFGAAVYASTKAAVTHLSRHFRLELAAQNVRVTDIQPGMVETDIRNGSELGIAWEKDMKTRITPLAADDVAELIAFTVARPAHVNLPEITVMPTRQT